MLFLKIKKIRFIIKIWIYKKFGWRDRESVISG